MRKPAIYLLLAILFLSLTGCAQPQFDGSRTGNESQLVMEYAVLNKTETQDFTLAVGDVLAFDIVSESGTVNISVQKGDDTPIYQGNGVPTSSFEVTITDAGTYKCTVVGRQAKGSVSIVKLPPLDI